MASRSLRGAAAFRRGAGPLGPPFPFERRRGRGSAFGRWWTTELTRCGDDSSRMHGGERGGPDARGIVGSLKTGRLASLRPNTAGGRMVGVAPLAGQAHALWNRVARGRPS